MASKSRGGLSAREYAAKQSGKAMPYLSGSSGSSVKSSSGSSLSAPKAPKTGSFSFDSSKLVPTYQAEAASIYNPQIQQVQGLQALTKSQSEDAKVKTKDEFAQLLKREQENINRRGAFFSGGAIDQENRIGAQEGGALRDIGYQEQSANLQYQGTLSEIAQAQKDYVSSKVEGAYSSAYKTFQDKISNQLNQYQLELGQYNQDRAFEQSKIESDRNYALSAAASGRAGSSAAGTSPELRATAAALQKTGGDWEQTAQMLADQGYDVSEGSVIDNELRRRNGLPAIGGQMTTEQMKAQNAQITGANQAYTAAQAVSRLSEMSGLSSAVGPISSKLPTLSGETADFERQVEQVKSLLVLPELQQLRGLGAMSDREFATLSSAATTLNLNMSEQGFKDETKRVREALSGTLNKAATIGIFNPNYVNVYDLNTGQAGQIPDYEYDPDKYQKR